MTRRELVESAALLTASSMGAGSAAAAESETPEWVRGITRMAFVTPDDADAAIDAGAQLVHFNLVWPHFPLFRDGGRLKREEDTALRKLVDRVHRRGARASLGLPPFMPVTLAKAHPDWRTQPDRGKDSLPEPEEGRLDTRSGCNNGPWGEYLIDVCSELAKRYSLDGFSFDGNYHPALCYCVHCRAAYRADLEAELPARANLEDEAYRAYLVWRGERLEMHYRRLRERIRAARASCAITSWTVNAGRYGHFLTSPRAMPSRLNRLFDLPMQEWWQDETNLGGSLVPAFGAAYLRAVSSGTAACEPYMMSRGNPYGTNSFPAIEQYARAALALTHGCGVAQSLGWPGHRDTALSVLREFARRDRWLPGARPAGWAAMLVSEQTRQFYAHRDIANLFLPHPLGIFRMAMEEHLPLALINDWEIEPSALERHRVLILPNAAALSDAQIEAIRSYVFAGGGLVATCESSLFDELGRPRERFGLEDLFGVKYRGRPVASDKRPDLDANFAVTVDENYWRQRTGVVTLRWNGHPLVQDARLQDLVRGQSVICKSPQVLVTPPQDRSEVAVWLRPEGEKAQESPAAVVRGYGRGRVVYLASGLDAALWSYAYPYQRRMLRRAVELAAGAAPPMSAEGPMCIQATFWEQREKGVTRLVVYLYNALDTAAGHGLPGMDVPLREETVPVAGMRVRIPGAARRLRLEPEGIAPRAWREGPQTVVEIPPLALHTVLVAELP